MSKFIGLDENIALRISMVSVIKSEGSKVGFLVEGEWYWVNIDNLTSSLTAEVGILFLEIAEEHPKRTITVQEIFDDFSEKEKSKKDS